MKIVKREGEEETDIIFESKEELDRFFDELIKEAEEREKARSKPSHEDNSLKF
ncbi:hypothetical protein [Sulfolobus acidocaldarius]|uniref:Conserved protein n=3 Tax=Sulfolobus acidocaldarius TaxID=2285 RepID=Q4JBC1_SULAC|nr:hypothetical protein [Sulfolobus acidocaldarius]AAY79908.1 conserved protein [Sulfolobus acidocaldarius DSM 639]AGE70474.1 hypothetical protein SacN8_02470 [Sulfolobus acidocaldarius N8]AGE72747.1 hypothetical protein SacRon12I_02460 [Sulfolobus acidocaldarius Ron12/I]